MALNILFGLLRYSYIDTFSEIRNVLVLSASRKHHSIILLLKSLHKVSIKLTRVVLVHCESAIETRYVRKSTVIFEVCPYHLSCDDSMVLTCMSYI